MSVAARRSSLSFLANPQILKNCKLLHALHVLLRKRNYVSYVTYVVRHFHATG